ncbi:hypothetical protein FJ366_03030 [Candidatus Dependentiae bacterium]|nr:hypothetical protein [Candidatus Dependentiae bacterium]
MNAFIRKFLCILGALSTAPFFAATNKELLTAATEKVIRLHALQKKISPDQYITALSNKLFCRSDFAYQMVVKKLIKDICKKHSAQLSTPMLFFTNVLKSLDMLLLSSGQTLTRSTFLKNQKESPTENTKTTYSTEFFIIAGVIASLIITYLVWENHEAVVTSIQKKFHAVEKKESELDSSINETKKDVLKLSPRVDSLEQNQLGLSTLSDGISKKLVFLTEEEEALAEKTRSQEEEIRRLNEHVTALDTKVQGLIDAVTRAMHARLHQEGHFAELLDDPRPVVIQRDALPSPYESGGREGSDLLKALSEKFSWLFR